MGRTKIVRIIVSIITFGLVVLGIWFYQSILLYILISFIFAYLISPIINFGSKHGIPRALSILAVYILIIGLIILMINVLIPQIRYQAEEVSNFVKSLQKKIDASSQNGEFTPDTMLNALGLKGLAKIITNLQEKYTFIEIDKYISDLIDKLVKLISKIPQFLLNSISSIINLLAFIVVIPFISFFMLVDERRLRKTFFSWIPNRFFEFSIYLFEQIEESFGRFFRALLIESFIVFFLTYIGLLILKIPYAFSLSLIVGITNPIKFFGPFIGFVPIILVILLTATPNICLLYAIILSIIVQQIDSNILFPSLIGKGLGMHPLWILLTVIAGGYAFGILGLIFAVPVVFLIKTIISVSAKSLKEFEII